jgi:hypothetical protein
MLINILFLDNGRDRVGTRDPHLGAVNLKHLHQRLKPEDHDVRRER